MFKSTGLRFFLVAAIVAVVMGGLGFAVGYVVRPILVVDTPAVTSTVEVRIVTSTPLPAEPTVVPTPSLEPPTPTSEPPAPTPTAVPTSTIDSQVEALFSEVWKLIQRDYYGKLPPDEIVVDGAIRGALNTLDDPFTGYIEPKAAAINRQDDSGSFEGIGAFVNMEDGRLVIVEPIKGGPAEAQGVRADDIVLQVDDTPIQNMSIYEAIGLIRGPAGTSVRLKILRQDQDPFEVTIVRAKIEIQVVQSSMRDDGVAYVSLTEFSSDASVKLASAIQDLLAQNPKGLILDLRGNPGGWLGEAVLVAGLFLPKDQLVVIERASDGTEQRLTTPDAPIAPDIPLVVLVDGASASASEIVAGALQDTGRAVLVGEKTFGKGSVQWPEALSNGAELRVTVAHWFTPNDHAIHGVGLTPDFAVELTQDDVDANRDPQLDRAVEYLLTGK